MIKNKVYLNYGEMIKGLMSHAEATGPEAEEFVASFFQHLKTILIKDI